MADRIEIEVSISPTGEVRAREKTGEFYERAASGTVRVKRER